jgi:hypothetical protein
MEMPGGGGVSHMGEALSGGGGKPYQRPNGTIQTLQIDVTLDVGNKFVRRKEKNRLTNKGR